MGNVIQNLAKNLQKYLLLYSLVAIFSGLVLGTNFTVQNKNLMSDVATVLVFLMIYPMMINLNISRFPSFLKKPKAILLSLIYNFAITPLISILMIHFFINDPDLAVGFLLVMLIPGSSMSIGYTGLAGGSLEVATIALGINFVLIPVLLPIFIHIMSSSYHIAIPIWVLIKTILLVLIPPMILGDLTRRAILKKKGVEKFIEIKPFFSTITMLSMLFIVGLIFFMKADLLIKKWQILALLSVLTLAYIVIMLTIITWIDKKMGLSYGEHMGIAFLSTGKNNGTAIAIAMLAFSPMVAIPAATLPLFQIVFLILYLHFSTKIKNYFGEEVKNV